MRLFEHIKARDFNTSLRSCTQVEKNLRIAQPDDKVCKSLTPEAMYAYDSYLRVRSTEIDPQDENTLGEVEYAEDRLQKVRIGIIEKERFDRIDLLNMVRKAYWQYPGLRIRKKFPYYLRRIDNISQCKGEQQ